MELAKATAAEGAWLGWPPKGGVGGLGLEPAADPLMPALPKSQIRPSAATKRYPSPAGMEVMPTHGFASTMLPVEP